MLVILSENPVPVSIPILAPRAGNEKGQDRRVQISLLFRAGQIHGAYLRLSATVSSEVSNLRPCPHHGLFSQLLWVLYQRCFLIWHKHLIKSSTEKCHFGFATLLTKYEVFPVTQCCQGEEMN